MGHEVRHSKLKHIHRAGNSRTAVTTKDPPYSTPPPLGYPPVDNGGAAVPYYGGSVSAPYPTLNPAQEEQLEKAIADAKRHGRNERIGEVGAAVAGAFALYELNEAKVDPEHARRHKLEAKLAGAVAVGSANYAYHEHLEKKKSEHMVQLLSGGAVQKSKLSDTQKIKESFMALPGIHKHTSNKADHNIMQLTDRQHNSDAHTAIAAKHSSLPFKTGGKHEPCKHEKQGTLQNPCQKDRSPANKPKHRHHLW
ncbi:hypothetical protein KP509_03G059300 [Ceratopteris richardii]|uniref:Uncharacterized protein n=1 Tax=Ceratopteris richardii TaxID=49495 RepID=A0A8T2V7J9_CERRI|nr:hypothetical protein KP509_03G059300 [Ceratopteris richardii]